VVSVQAQNLPPDPSCKAAVAKEIYHSREVPLTHMDVEQGAHHCTTDVGLLGNALVNQGRWVVQLQGRKAREKRNTNEMQLYAEQRHDQSCWWSPDQHQ
jgi:hypothetical protein